jgi:predicted RNA binding protein YcfA (HicA-like mRNA interferase family)
MPRLPQLSATELLKRLTEIDPSIECRSGRGSHLFQLKRVVGGAPRFSTVAAHGNEPLKLGTLKGILRDLGIDDRLLRR